MVRHFRQWLAEAHDVEFLLEGNPFAQSIRRRGSDEVVPDEAVWNYLEQFFDTQFGRQTEIEGAAAAISELQREADVVVLTNLGDRYREARTAQLATHGIRVPVFTNLGPKGEALRRIVAEHGADRAVFIDDLAQHHASASEIVPQVSRLHFCGEPAIAPHVPCALRSGHAHARIDNWNEAVPWLLETLHGGRA